jgi:magnesium-transporting ATPase (P-type)
MALAEGRLGWRMREDEVPPEPSRLSFLGLVGMIDPLRSGVRKAVEDCHRSGIDVVMITGDHKATALAIARDLGLASREDQVAVGSDFLHMAPSELPALVDRIKVFARVAPEQKLKLVRAARERGHFVAVTGDGVNDAPALRAAHIGVAMGKGGTDVAREASDLVIADDNFATIVAGIEEGRVAYDNIRKVIYLLVSTGAAEIVLVTLAVITGSPLPLLPVQLLWLNLVTNGIQDVALAFEPAEDDVLRRRPRPPRERIFNRLMIERTLVAAAVMGAVAFGLFFVLLQAGWTEAAARNLLLLLMVLFENVHIGNCRSETKSALALSPLRSPILLGGAILALLLHVAAMHFPAGQTLLGVEPVGANEAGLLIALALAIFVAMEAHKWSWRLRYGRPS